MGKAGVKRGPAAAAVAMGAILAASASILAGCASKTFLPVNDAGDRTALPAGGAAPAAPPPVQPSAQATPARDQCGAAALQYLVGKDKAEMPVALVPSRRRVVCTTCPSTMDMRPDRQTVRYDEATKKVVSITCG